MFRDSVGSPALKLFISVADAAIVSGALRAPGYEVYDALARKDSALERIGCLAHARRRFYQALQESVSEAVWFVGPFRITTLKR